MNVRALTADLKSFKKCIIAEVYGWTNCYMRVEPKYCPECRWSALAFSFIINGPDFALDAELLRQKDNDFCKHWVENHLEVLTIE
jgi:hypothetical protein